jgi:dihydroxynaphthoic acid synthetase
MAGIFHFSWDSPDEPRTDVNDTLTLNWPEGPDSKNGGRTPVRPTVFEVRAFSRQSDALLLSIRLRCMTFGLLALALVLAAAAPASIDAWFSNKRNPQCGLSVAGRCRKTRPTAGCGRVKERVMAKTSAKKPANKPNRAAGRIYRDILYEVKDQVAWVTINRERVLNAFREQSLDEMIDALKSTREDPSIACAVVTGAGDKAFSAGGDFYAMTRLDWTSAAMWNDRMQGLAMTIRGLPIPVIAMINGWCMGGGHELALWCDLAIASDNAVLGQTGAKVGACPTVGATQYLPRIIGERLAREMIFCARRFTASEAAAIGLINKCVAQKDLRKETLAWCETIKGHSPQTLRLTKKSLNFESDLLYASWQHGMELLAHVWGSPESLEGMNAFLEGRKPDFQKFRMRGKQQLEAYLEGCANDQNAPPSMRKPSEKNGHKTGNKEGKLAR